MCIRFSAWSNTIERSDVEDLVGHLERVEPGALEELLADAGVAVVEGREAVHEPGVAGCRCAPTRSAVTWYGEQQRRCARPRSRSASPMETQTSV